MGEKQKNQTQQDSRKHIPKKDQQALFTHENPKGLSTGEGQTWFSVLSYGGKSL